MVLAQQQDSLVGRTVDGRYLVREHIADGGMGSVYVALDTRLDRDIALKIMRPELARDPDFVDRFRREARSAARLAHANAVAVYDQGEDDGVVFLAMELVEGRTLRAWLTQAGALTPREALDVTGAVLSALTAAHAKGIIHRDIKPENVLIAGDGQVKVADFGLARAVTSTTVTGLTGPLLGTVAYLAPEQVEHGTADERSDLYAVGLLLHEMLTGRPAVEGATPINVAWQHVHGTFCAPSSRVPTLSRRLDDLVARATRRDPAGRPQDSADLLGDVRSVLAALSARELDRRPDVNAGTDGPDDCAHQDTGTIGRRTRVIGRAERAPAPTNGATAATPPRRSARRRWVSALLGLLATALLVAGNYWLLGPPSARVLPEVVGMAAVDAEGEVAAVDLDPITVEGYSETVQRGDIISSDPAAGTSLRRWDDVRLVVSKGPERYEVPDLTGLTPQQAQAALAATKLTAGRSTGGYDENVPAGQVVSSAPAAGASVKPDTAVSLVVSRGRQPIEVGDWVGTPLEDATTELEERGLTVSVAGEAFSSQVEKGSIISHDPVEGTLFRGDTVTVTVSKGPDLVEVPNVRGETVADARAQLERAGFSVELNRIAGGLFGTAHSTEPAAGKGAPRGGTVTLNIV